MSIVQESTLPRFFSTLNGKRLVICDYTSVVGSDTTIQVAKNLGAWKYKVGIDQSETLMNREVAKAIYAENKARVESMAAFAKSVHGDRNKLIEEFQKRNRTEDESDDSDCQIIDPEEEQEETNDADAIIQDLQMQIAALKTTLR